MQLDDDPVCLPKTLSALIRVVHTLFGHARTREADIPTPEVKSLSGAAALPLL